MARLFALVPALLLAVNAFAVAPGFWRLGSTDDFLGGELEGFAVTSRGELVPAPAAKKIASFDDPFVLSQASAPGGDRFFGTGNDGKVYRLRGGDLKVLFTAPEPEVYAVAFRGGALYVGTSPNGKVYRVDPESGKHSVFFEPGEAYIWTLAPAGDALLVGTGVEGKLYRVDPSGKGTVLFDSTDTHIRSLAVTKDGSILAGTSGKGRIYRIELDGAARALYESALNEISSIGVDESGVAWAAAVSNVLPSVAPPKSQARPAQQQQGTGTASAGGGGEAKKDEAPAAVEVSFSFDDSSSVAASQAGASELYRIDADGLVQTVRKFDREMIYAVAAEGGRVLVGTGPNGRVYEVKDRELSLIATVPEKQVVSIVTGAQTLVTTTNAGAVYRLESAAAGEPVFRSAAKDLERFARFGEYVIRGRNLAPGSIAVSFRSGNTKTPDETWSGWTPAVQGLEGSVSAPAARYLQWRVTMPHPATNAAIDEMTVGFMQRNLAPQIESLAVQDPAVVFISTAYPASPMLVEATNPDEYGIFTSLDAPSDRSSDPGKRAYRKGYRTVTWRASDENDDDLRYTLSFRAKGTDKWLRLRENLDQSQMNFDTSQLPDGLYELRLTASDGKSNPEAPLTASREGVEFLVDNTAPAIEASRNGGEVVLRIRDEQSPVGKVEYSVDAEKWIPLTPADGIADSRDETYRLSSPAGRFVVVRAVDSFSNVSTKSVQ